MAKQQLNITDDLYKYILNVSVMDSPVLKELREETNLRIGHRMQVPADQAHFMAFLIKLTNTRKILEIGTYTGYSALVMAQALPKDGKLITCDLNPETTRIAKRFWGKACVDDRIELRLGHALEIIAELQQEGWNRKFDMVFIDADKRSYDAYYEAALSLTHSGGLILIDNVLWQGKVIDEQDNDHDTVSIRNLNKKIADDQRVDACLLTIGDGLTIVRKR